MAALRLFVVIAIGCILLWGAVESAGENPLQSSQWGRSRWARKCSVGIASDARCPDSKICCVRASAVRCCPRAAESNTTVLQHVLGLESHICPERCKSEEVLGFEFSSVSIAVSLAILSILFFFGSALSGTMGRYSAIALERHTLIQNIRRRRREERAASKIFQRQLAQHMKEQEELEAAAQQALTAEDEENILCVICYARHIDVGIGPCGHVALCQFCCQRLRECPVCREVVKTVYALPSTLVHHLASERKGDECEPTVVKSAEAESREGELVTITSSSRLPDGARFSMSSLLKRNHPYQKVDSASPEAGSLSTI